MNRIGYLAGLIPLYGLHTALGHAQNQASSTPCNGLAGQRPQNRTIKTADVRKLYAGPVRDDKGQAMYFGWPRGSESGWGTSFVDPPEPVRLDFWRSWVYDNHGWQPRHFDVQKAVEDARIHIPFTEAVRTDLRAFAGRGGKLLMYQGWADPAVPPENSIAYFNTVRDQGKTDLIELFMAPGMGYCGGGAGASEFDALDALDRWVPSGTPPERITAAKREGGKTILERPLCPYPQELHWDGLHDTSKAWSFSCVKEISTR